MTPSITVIKRYQTRSVRRAKAITHEETAYRRFVAIWGRPKPEKLFIAELVQELSLSQDKDIPWEFVHKCLLNYRKEMTKHSRALKEAKQYPSLTKEERHLIRKASAMLDD